MNGLSFPSLSPRPLAVEVAVPRMCDLPSPKAEASAAFGQLRVQCLGFVGFRLRASGAWRRL